MSTHINHLAMGHKDLDVGKPKHKGDVSDNNPDKRHRGTALAQSGDDNNLAFGSGKTESPTDSDPDDNLSLYDLDAFDFPVPPPICTPAIRRIKSSPWFNNPSEDFRHGGDHLFISAAQPHPKRLPYSPQNMRILLESEINIIDTSAVAGPSHFQDGQLSQDQTPYSNPEIESKPNVLIYPLDRRYSKAENRTLGEPQLWFHPINQVSKYDSGGSNNNSNLRDQETMRCIERQAFHPFILSPLPRIIRKVASMEMDSTQNSELLRNTRLIPVDQKPLLKRRSFQTMFRLFKEDIPNHDDTRAIVHDRHDYRNGDELCDPFYRSTARKPQISEKKEPIFSKSFMDISPDKRQDHAKKERFRALIARASDGIFTWNKRITRQLFPK